MLPTYLSSSLAGVRLPHRNFTHHAIDTVVFLSISDDVDNTTKEDEQPQSNEQSNLFIDLLLLLQLLRCNYSFYNPCFISSLVITTTHSYDSIIISKNKFGTNNNHIITKL